MKVKVRKSQARKIEAAIEGKRSKHKDVESFVEAAVADALRELKANKPGKRRPAKRAKAKKAAKRPVRPLSPAPPKPPGQATASAT